MKHTIIEPQSPLPQSLARADRRSAIEYHMAALEELSDPSSRIDGWTPFNRKLFLQVLAETGRVTQACDYCRLSKQSAYALRARDPIFAAGWDAACELARMPLADALYEQALDGLTDTITRDDGSKITRHRFDSRLSIAVLNRLDRRCDRAAEQGSRHTGAVANWDSFTAAIGRGDEEQARALLDAAQRHAAETAQLSQLSQLCESMNSPESDWERLSERVWWDEDGEEWRTDFPPPPGFDGDEIKDPDERYSRSLTVEEYEAIEQSCAVGDAEERARQEVDRDRYFATLRAGIADGVPDTDVNRAQRSAPPCRDDEGEDAPLPCEIITPPVTPTPGAGIAAPETGPSGSADSLIDNEDHHGERGNEDPEADRG